MFKQPKVKKSPQISDEIRKTTCYMCACRCGIDVHIKNGKVAYIEGNRDHPINRGVLCAKGSAGIMQVNSPARLRTPLKRVGARGTGAFKEISWEEALKIASDQLAKIRRTDPSKLAFFTGRDQSQSFTSYWAQNYGTPNYAAHGGFCSVNMAAAGIYTMGGSFWEFGQPDWQRTKLLILFGVAEDHDSNPIKIGLGHLKKRKIKIISVNPIRTGYSAIADEWIGITPGTDGVFIGALIYELLRAGKIDLDYLAQFTNAPLLLDSNAKSKNYGLFLRDAHDKPLVMDRISGKVVAFDSKGIHPDLRGIYHAYGIKHKTVFNKIIKLYMDAKYTPESAAQHCGIKAQTIRRIAAELAYTAFDRQINLDISWIDFRGNKHEKMIGRPVSFHAMRGISAHANGFQTCRGLHILQILLGSVEVPGGFRFKPPYPKAAEAHPPPHYCSQPNSALAGPHLGFVQGPEDLALRADGTPARIDKAFTWENPLSVHGLMHMVISNAYAGDPYKIDTLFMYMANMSWNSSMAPAKVDKMLTARDATGKYIIPNIIYSDAYYSEMVAYADLVLPDTTYLERYDCISLLDRPISEANSAADAIRWPVIAPDRNVRSFQSVLCDLAVRLGLPGFVNLDGTAIYKNYADYMVHHERRTGVGPLAGFRGDGNEVGRGSVNNDQLNAYIKNGGFFTAHIPPAAQYYKPWNMAYQDWAVKIGLFDQVQPYLFQLYVEPMRKFQLAAEGIGMINPPDYLRTHIHQAMQPLPLLQPCKDSKENNNDFYITALTQRPMAMYHSWGTQNAWLRQIHGYNPLYIPKKLWFKHQFQKGDWARVTSLYGEIIVPVAYHSGLNENTVWTWNAIGKRKGTWAINKNAPEVKQGFLLNHLISELLPSRNDGLRWSNSDPVTGQAAWFDLKVKIERLIYDVPLNAQSSPSFAVVQSVLPIPSKDLIWQVK